jgi:hypothetical protein
MHIATIYTSQIRLGAPGNYESVLIFYVDKRERMIVFMDMVVALPRVVAEVSQLPSGDHRSLTIVVANRKV